MKKVNLQISKKTGKPKVSLQAHGNHVIRILCDLNSTHYKPGNKRHRAWQVVSLMDGLTLQEGHEILRKLEPNIEGKVGQPIGWIRDAIQYGYAELCE